MLNGCWHGFAIEDDLSKPVHERALWELAEQLCPVERNHDYTQAIMDLGATVCTPKSPYACIVQCSNIARHINRVWKMNCLLKSQKPVPVKAAQVLLIQSGDEWLWQQRPNSGLWGGLWSLPIIEDTHAFEQLCQQLGLKNLVQKVQISHSFTHFTWQLEAMVLQSMQISRNIWRLSYKASG